MAVDVNQKTSEGQIGSYICESLDSQFPSFEDMVKQARSTLDSEEKQAFYRKLKEINGRYVE